MVSIAVHAEPIWRGVANFVARAPIEDGFEQLWTRKEDDRHVICCIPFFVYDLALGDTVLLDANGVVEGVVSRSGRNVARLWFGDSDEDQTAILTKLHLLGAQTERSSPNLVAVDYLERSAVGVEVMLTNGHDQGLFVFERGNQGSRQ